MKGAKVKGILLSLIAILLVSGMTGVAYASFDTVNKQNNFSNDKVGLMLMDQNKDEEWQNGVSGTWVVTDMAPGDEFAFDESFVGLWGDFPGKIEITCDYTAAEGPPSGDPDNVDTSANPDSFARYMEITYAQYMDDLWYYNLLTGEKYTRLDSLSDWNRVATDAKWRIEDQAYLGATDGIISLYDLKWSPLTNLPSPRKSGDDGTRFEMSVKFHEAAGNEFQGDTFNLTMIFTLKTGQAKGKAH